MTYQNKRILFIWQKIFYADILLIINDIFGIGDIPKIQ
jgi:hypothetical protein